MTQIASITNGQLLMCLAFVFIAGLASVAFHLKLERDLLWGTVRTFAQLFMVGYALKYVFLINHPAPILGIYIWMIFWAARAVRSRVNDKKIPIFIPTFITMALSYVLITSVVTSVIIRVEPWYEPRYFIPLGGMIIGNSMNAVSITLDRMLSDIKSFRQEIELSFCLGATYQEATTDILRNAIKAGMIPSINALMTVGLVSLPGMMTGQILAGSPPLTAVKYQIVVMLMLAASTAIGSVGVSLIIRKMCFTKAHQLLV